LFLNNGAPAAPSPARGRLLASWLRAKCPNRPAQRPLEARTCLLEFTCRGSPHSGHRCAPPLVRTMGTFAVPEDHYSAQVESVEGWSVERHLADKSKAVVDLHKRFVGLLTPCGPYTVSVTKTAIAFNGTHRSLAGAKPRRTSLDGFLDLQREVHDERFLRVSPYTKSLYVHQFRITSAAQLDDSFAALVEEAYQVGRGTHRLPRKTG